MPISGWDIEPSAVFGILADVRGRADSLGQLRQSMFTQLENCSSDSGSGIVSAALLRYASTQAPEVRFTETRTFACVHAASQATSAYQRSDEQMAANAQSSAASAPEPAQLVGQAAWSPDDRGGRGHK